MATGTVAGATLLWRSLRGGAPRGLAKGAAAALAALAPFVYDQKSDIAAAYRGELDGRRLSLCPREEDGFEDEETGTRWDVLGRGLAGEFTGRALDPVLFSFDKVFWFAWKHYHQDTALFRILGEQERPETPYVGQPPR